MNINVTPEIARLALQTKTEIACYVWFVLRQTTNDNNGSSVFTKLELHDALRAAGFSRTKRHINRIIQQGTGIYWNTDSNHRVFIRNKTRVIHNLISIATHTEIKYLHDVTIPSVSDTQQIRAYFYASWFCARGEVTIARDTITELFGLSRDQQRAYESLLSDVFLVKSNYKYYNSLCENRAAVDALGFSDHSHTIQASRVLHDAIRVNYHATFDDLPNTYLVRIHSLKTVTSRSSRMMYNQIKPLWRANSCKQLGRNRVFFYHDKQRNREDDLDNLFNGLHRVYWQGKKRLWISGHQFYTPMGV